VHHWMPCSVCGKAIPETDIEKGLAVVHSKRAYCRDCRTEIRRGAKASETRMPSDEAPAAPSPDDPYPTASPYPPRRFRHGSHACGFYRTPAERLAQAVNFVQEGLRLGEKVKFIADASETTGVPEFFRKGGFEVEPYLKSGQLELLPASQVYAPKGSFKPAEMIATVKDMLDQVLREGYPALRILGEMTWALRQWPGSEQLADYELAVNCLFPKSKLIALCQYDATRFAPPLLAAISRSHPLVFMDVAN